MAKAPATNRKTVVHLGNVGKSEHSAFCDQAAEKTRRYALRFPDVHFVGIDLLPHKRNRPNWTQLTATFEKGLERMPNESCAIISSEMAVGYYLATLPENQRTQKLTTLFRIAAHKLSSGGKLMITADLATSQTIMEALRKAGFENGHVELRPIKPNERNRTFWMKKVSGTLYQVIAKKPKRKKGGDN